MGTVADCDVPPVIGPRIYSAAVRDVLTLGKVVLPAAATMAHK